MGALKRVKDSYLRKSALILILGLAVFMSGCLGQEETNPLEFKNDVITIEEYSVSTLDPYAESITTIDFMIKNNGERSVPRATVKFFQYSGFEIVELMCENVRSADGVTCVFDESHPNGPIETLDVRQVTATLKAPESEVIRIPTSFRISFYVNYSYYGHRRVEIPVIDGTTIVTPPSDFQFSESSPFYAPIQVEFEPPIGRQRKEEDRVINEYWTVYDRPYEVKMNFRHVGSVSGTVGDLVLHAGDVNVSLINAEIAIGEGGPILCDFEEGSRSDQIFSFRDLRVPNSLKCVFRTPAIGQPAVMAALDLGYFYSYKYTRTEDFRVLPLRTN